jgi:hypothetical protein
MMTRRTPGEMPIRAGETERVRLAMTDLDRLAPDLEGLRDAIRLLSMDLPARLSLRQAVAFLFVMHASTAGHRVTMTDVRDFFSDADGSNVSQSIANTFQIFLSRSKQEPNGLGWVNQDPDEDDRRKKYLRLSYEGEEIARRIVSALNRYYENDS